MATLTLWVRGRFFDEHTGARLDPPEIQVLPDRQPQPGVPDPGGAWWPPLLQRGWLELPPPGPSMRYLLTDAGRALTVCEGLAPDLLLAQVTRADLRHHGRPLTDRPAARWQPWELAPQVRASAPRVRTPAAARLLEPHRHPPPAAPASAPAPLPPSSRSRP
ncbi:hypothetical protein [Nonomuraea sp. KM90]|uniref:hypothetical protein n=1 Tax=Nonomuraea sp. KM90 TaxID=3457428 RepID=UPI003FCE1448